MFRSDFKAAVDAIRSLTSQSTKIVVNHAVPRLGKRFRLHMQTLQLDQEFAERSLTPKVLRASKGEEFLRERAVAKAKNLPIPVNPLHHTSNKTTERFYARKIMNCPYDARQSAYEATVAAPQKRQRRK